MNNANENDILDRQLDFIYFGINEIDITSLSDEDLINFKYIAKELISNINKEINKRYNESF